MANVDPTTAVTTTTQSGRISGRTTPIYSQQVVDFVSTNFPKFDHSMKWVPRTEEEIEARDEVMVRWETLKKYGIHWTENDPIVTAKLVQTGLLAVEDYYNFLPRRSHYSFHRDFNPADVGINFWLDVDSAWEWWDKESKVAPFKPDGTRRSSAPKKRCTQSEKAEEVKSSSSYVAEEVGHASSSEDHLSSSPGPVYEDTNAFPNDDCVYHEQPLAVEEHLKLPLVDESSSILQDHSVDGDISGAKRARSSHEEEENTDEETPSSESSPSFPLDARSLNAIFNAATPANTISPLESNARIGHTASQMITLICARTEIALPDDIISIGDKADYLWAKIMRRSSVCPDKINIQLIQMMDNI